MLKREEKEAKKKLAQPTMKRLFDGHISLSFSYHSFFSMEKNSTSR